MNRIVILILFFFIVIINNLSAKEIFLSLKKNKVNVRYGPGLDYPIKYIYEKINLPIKLIDRKENFRRIIDQKNNSGWIHISQLKKSNSIIILEDKILFKKPTNFSKPLFLVKKGRMLLVKRCKIDWCFIESNKYSGWIKTENIWGKVN
tara:strand:+ start:439 stop:885 length:447 start_codon:yes stop_codon:yes gene_type:complete